MTAIRLTMAWLHVRMSFGTGFRTEVLTSDPDRKRFLNTALAKRAVTKKKYFSHHNGLKTIPLFYDIERVNSPVGNRTQPSQDLLLRIILNEQSAAQPNRIKQVAMTSSRTTPIPRTKLPEPRQTPALSAKESRQISMVKAQHPKPNVITKKTKAML